MVFEEIYKTYWDKVYRLCMGYVNDEAWAKDIAQDTFMTVWQQLSNFRNESAIGTWIFRIACNNCLRQIERNSRFVKKEIPEKGEEIPVDRDKELAFLYQCISALKEMDRLIISMELEDIRQAEIAGILGISESNVRVKIYRIKEKLTQKFKDYER
jgi:RNA polymerase sigma-70 factor, ECF subfamily